MTARTPGKFEFDLLSFLHSRGPCGSREIFEEFGKPKGYVRGTIVKALDRLFRAGKIQRDDSEGKFVYSVTDGAITSDSSLVATFIQDRLNGRLAPLVAFFNDSEELTEKDKQALADILKKLE